MEIVMVKRSDICEQCAAKIVFLWIKSLTAKHLGRQEKTDPDLYNYQPSRLCPSLGSLERRCRMN